MKTILTLVLLSFSIVAQARPAKCLLLVDGVTYINSVCDYSSFKDGSGSFSIGGAGHSNYFAYLLISDGAAEGYWNGVEAASHAQTDLGPMKRNGACRFNDRAMICAW